METTNFLPEAEHPLKQPSKKWIFICGFVALLLVGGTVAFFFTREPAAPVVVEQPQVEEVPTDYVPPEFDDNLDAAFADLQAIDN